MSREQLLKAKEKRGSLGLASLSDQVYRKASKKGFEFTVMLIGESGLGKSTLIDALFAPDEGAEDVQNPTPTHPGKKTVRVSPRTRVIAEKGVSLKLTIVDTPGFGDAIDNTECWAPILEYVNEAYQSYLDAELKVDRKHIDDRRVHCCVYFLNPSNHGLRTLDINAMKALHNKVNIIPVIAKSDTLTKAEIKVLKQKLMQEIEQHGINVYRPALDEQDDEDTYNNNLSLIGSMPFAVVGSVTLYNVAGSSVRGRQYPWGIVEVNNEAHCDFPKLRNMIVKTHMSDLKEITEEVLYESYRKEALLHTGPKIRSSVTTLEASNASEINFPVEQKNVVDSEAELIRRHEQMKRDLEMQTRLFEEKKRQFEEEKRKHEEAMAKMKLASSSGSSSGDLV